MFRKIVNSQLLALLPGCRLSIALTARKQVSCTRSSASVRSRQRTMAYPYSPSNTSSRSWPTKRRFSPGNVMARGTHRERQAWGKSESGDHVVHKSEHSIGQNNSCPSFWFVLWNSVLPPYWRTALGRRDRDRTCCLGAMSQSGPQKSVEELAIVCAEPPCRVVMVR